MKTEKLFTVNKYKISVLLLAFVFAIGAVVTAGVSTPDVDIGSSGIQINTGTLDVNGNDIEDAGTTIWDQSAGQIATGVVDYTAATASDVGLGNVRNVDLSNAAGNDITYDTNNENFDVSSSNIQSGTTASDVGLGNADNADELDLDGSETMSGDLDMGSFPIDNADEIYENDGSGNQIDVSDVDGGILIKSDSNDGDDITLNSGSGDVNTDSNFDLGGNDLNSVDQINGGGTGVFTIQSPQDDSIDIDSDGALSLVTDDDADSGGPYTCEIGTSDGSINCDGSKNWVHQLNQTHEAVYSAQESPEVRAVFEGQTKVTDSKKVELPSHFSKTVSDTKPKMRAQVTPRGTLTNAAAMKVTDDYIKIKVGEETQVDYRVTGIREGYEDKQVVREKQ